MDSTSFSFAWPWLAVLLPLPLLARLLRRGGRAAPPRGPAGGPVLRHPHGAKLRMAFGGQRAAPSRGWSGALLMALIWAALVLALMRPQWLTTRTEVVNPGYDLMLAVDVSRSMEALDFEVGGQRVNRLAVVKGVLGDFIERRAGDRLGLILFGETAYLQAPLTPDGPAVRQLLDASVPRMLGNATALGDAIALAVKKLRARPEGSRVLILLTDGKSTAGRLPPTAAIRMAAHYGVRIYTIGVGSQGPVPIREGGQLVRRTLPLDAAQLQAIAEATGGAYFRATDTQALESIYQRIDALEPTEAEVERVRVPTPLYRWPLGVAMLGLVLVMIRQLRREWRAGA